MARARVVAVLLVLLSGAVGVISATQTWLQVTVEDGARDPLPVSGAAALPVLAPLSLTALALGAALAIVGLALRYVFGALSVVIAAILGIATATIAVTTPVAAVVSAVTGATGIAGVDSVAEIATRIDPTPWPYLTLVAWVILLVAGALILATAHRWSRSGRKYATSGASAGAGDAPAARRADAVDSWDELSRGQDPTA